MDVCSCMNNPTWDPTVKTHARNMGVAAASFSEAYMLCPEGRLQYLSYLIFACISHTMGPMAENTLSKITPEVARLAALSRGEVH